MKVLRPSHGICSACSSQLLSLFTYGFCEGPRASSLLHQARISSSHARRSIRTISTSRSAEQQVSTQESSKAPKKVLTPQHVESLVQQTRQTFGETVPKDFLSPDEHRLYERLYGAPLYKDPGNIGVLVNLAQQDLEAQQAQKNALLREDENGNLEHVDYVPQPAAAEEEQAYDSYDVETDVYTETENAQELKTLEQLEAKVKGGSPAQSQFEYPSNDAVTFEKIHGEFVARLTLFKDIAVTQQAQAAVEEEQHDKEAELENDEDQEVEELDTVEQATAAAMQDIERDMEPEEIDEDSESGLQKRTHPFTLLGRSGTSPGTIFLPKDSVADPIQALLRGASKRHMADVTTKTFGGPSLPDSVATPPKKGLTLHQKAVALDASQQFMGEMEGNAFLSAIMPGAYASVMSILVEIRKRLGSDWLRNLVANPEMTRILDVGSGGAAVQAWRELLKAESALMHGGVALDKEVNGGKATVVTGSDVLRHRASRLLENTSFLPRLPDYSAARDHPTLGFGANPQPRKQYDIIFAPYTLWHLKEDWMRKEHVQNLWSLLKADGGVLILLEKGLPRGFELIAGAREVLLKYHIEGSDLQGVDHQAPGTFAEKANTKEKGMIIAPCTNHSQCPMYTTPGQSKGRKDLCHFNQRFIRPPYLQRILGRKEGNHEDIRFSYLAVRRGVDLRDSQKFAQGAIATDEAFAGFEEVETDPPGAGGHVESSETESPSLQRSSPYVPPVSSLSLPRAILPPIKRRGHVILDLCTPAAQIERWTVPKSFSKQAYHDARKSKWGDLWALGAKTRIQRNIRLGSRSEKPVRRRDEEFEGEEVDGPVKDFQNTRRRGDTMVRGKDRGKRRKVRNALAHEEEDE